MIRLLFLVFFLYGCRIIAPTPPRAVKSLAPPPKLIVSHITMPIDINLNKGFKEIEKQVPVKFQGTHQPCSGFGYSYDFERDPFIFGFQDNSIITSVSGGLGLQVNYCPGCHGLFKTEQCIVPRVYGSCGTNGEPKRKLNTQFQTSIQLKNNFTLTPNTKLNYVKLLDECQFSFMKFSVTKEIEGAIYSELVKQEKQIDQQISAVTIRPQLIWAWEKLQEPIRLKNFGFLYLQPKSISFGKLTFARGSVKTRLQLALSPTVLDNTSSMTPKTELPDAVPEKTANEFSLYIDIKASYDSLSLLITKSLKKNPVKIKQKTVNIDSVSLFQVSLDTLGMKVEFSGYNRGTLYLKGVPKLDALEQKLYINDLSFTLSTQSVLLKGAKWMYSEKILTHLKQKSTFDLLPHIEEIKKITATNLNQNLSPEVQLSGRLLDFSTKEFYVQENNILVRCLMNVDMKLDVVIP
ncbi:MAG: DUF4403 family protein [Bacteroidetes bacterium]|nr:DUF4403 family protein [Bacteroidota bacterium]